jgi:phosphatidylserine decarboxylase
MSRMQYPYIAREGWPLIAIAVACGVFAWFIDPEWSALFAALAFALVLKFRDPDRAVPSEALGVVSPVDGVVESVETVQDPCLDREAICIRMQIHLFGSYSARAPVEGKVMDNPKQDNGHAPTARGLRLQTDEGDEVVLIINTAPSWARPRSMLGYGSRIGQGQRAAWVRLARIAEVYLPTSTRIQVVPGRRVLAGSDLLGSLVHD